MDINKKNIMKFIEQVDTKDILEYKYPKLEILIYCILTGNNDIFEKTITQYSDSIDFSKKLDFSPETQSFNILHLAAIEGNFYASKLLIESKKIDIESMTTNKITPFMMVCKKGYCDLVNLFVDNGAHIEKKSKSKTTPLIFASSVNSDNHLEIVKKLVDKNVDINYQNKKGNTALITASVRSPKTAEFLTKIGADIHIKNNDGKTAFDYAIKGKNKSLIELLANS